MNSCGGGSGDDDTCGIHCAPLGDAAERHSTREVASLLQQFLADEPALAACRLDPRVLLPALQRWAFAKLQSGGRWSVGAYDAASGALVGVSLNFLKMLETGDGGECGGGDGGNRHTGDASSNGSGGDDLNGYGEQSDGMSSNAEALDEARGWLAYHWPDSCIRLHEEFIKRLEERAARRFSAGEQAAAGEQDAPALKRPARPPVCRCLQVGILLCRRDCRGRGIAQRLVERSLELAKLGGCEAVLATASSAYSQRVFEKLGFARDAEALYEEHPYALLFDERDMRLHRAFVAYSRRL